MPASVRCYDDRHPNDPDNQITEFHIRGPNDVLYHSGHSQEELRPFVVPGSGGGETHELQAFADYPSPAPTAIHFDLAIPASPGGTAFAEWQTLVLMIFISAGNPYIQSYPIAALSQFTGNQARNIDLIYDYPSANRVTITYTPNDRNIRAVRSNAGIHLGYAALIR